MHNNKPKVIKKLKDKRSVKSRLDRRKYKLNKHTSSQTRIPYYFPILNRIEATLKRNKEIIEELKLQLESKCSDYNVTSLNIPHFLRILMETAIKNNTKGKHGRKYSDEIKLFGSYLLITAGPMVYDFVYSNMQTCLPCQSTLDNFMALSMKPVEEGVLRVDELKEYLISNNYPLEVAISEDGTRLVPKLLYNAKSDQIVGASLPLSANGMPQTNAYPASTAALIARHFATTQAAGNAYVIMAQPLAPHAAPFCLMIMATDNKFTAEHVRGRMDYIKHELSKKDIKAVTFSADGDPKVLCAHQAHMFPPTSVSPAECPEVYCEYQREDVVVQDLIHLANKYKTRFYKESVCLPIGKYVASQSHLKILIENVDKAVHVLTKNDLKKQDKMNFSASEKISSERVTDCLKDNIKGSEGTRAYLGLMRDIITSFHDNNLSPLERLYLFWRVLAFLRIWRNWILSSKKFNLRDNFVTYNLYICMEINAHAILRLLMLFRDGKISEKFILKLFSSQACESFFRLLRSLTTTLSTVVNFTMLDLLYRVRKVETLLYVSSKLSSKGFSLPTDKRKHLKAAMFNSFPLPSDEEIYATIKQAFSDAADQLEVLGIPKRPLNLKLHPFASTLCPADFEDDTEEFEELQIEITEDDVPLDILAAFRDPDPGSINFEEEPSALKKSVDKRFVYFIDSKKKLICMRKTTLCWTLTHEGTRVSSDRVQRVQGLALQSVHQRKKPTVATVTKREEIEIGQWCAFRMRKSLTIYGQILEFSYLTGKKSFSLEKVPVKAPARNARGIGCLAVWFKPLKNGTLTLAFSSQEGFINIEKYIATIPAPLLNEDASKLMMSNETIAAVRVLSS